MIDALRHFEQVWLVDFEFRAPAGGRPAPVCMVAREFRTGRTLRLWSDELATMPAAPFDVADGALFVAYYASAEMGCFLALDWPMPTRILDLFTEFRNSTNGLTTPCGASLLGALAANGIDGIDASDKEEMRALAMREGEHSEAERRALLDYCQTDVDALAKLLDAMLPTIDLPRALLRGRYMAAAARMEWTGTPIDAPTLDRLRNNWTAIKSQLITAIDADFGVYVPTDCKLDPNSRLGQAILATAAEYGIGEHALAQAVDTLYAERQAGSAEHAKAVAAASQATGLTPKRIAAIEDSGATIRQSPGSTPRHGN